MKKSKIECALLVALAGCASRPASPLVLGGARAPEETPSTAPVSSVSSEPAPFASPPSASARASVAPPPAVSDSTAGSSFPPPRPSTLRLGPGELSAGDDAFERADYAAAQNHYERSPRGAAREVGLARVKIARV